MMWEFADINPPKNKDCMYAVRLPNEQFIVASLSPPPKHGGGKYTDCWYHEGLYISTDGTQYVELPIF